MGAASAEPDDLGDSPAAPGAGTRGGGPGADRGESTFTVLVAAGANLGIAVAKAVAGIISGSSAMLSEAAHSVADTVTELLLLTALRRSAHPPDEALAALPLADGEQRPASGTEAGQAGTDTGLCLHEAFEQQAART
ncbi:cation transporter, partial [Streptomyces albidoflavus]|uniref:cation transporter n=1 Tax=Streptomyces albidoflavus TaxID=1886 RepID=UPI00211C99DF